MIRVVVTGSECTGKTTLAGQLAAYFDAELVPEYVREYAEHKAGPIDAADHDPIARGQLALEEAAIARGNRLVVQDTDLLSTVVYARHYAGACPPWIVAAAASRRPDLYLLCDIDVPWTADGIRDRGERREEMQGLFRDAVRRSGAPMVELRGDPRVRMEQAVDAIDLLLLRDSAGGGEQRE
jgi:NadR type nicotinamide-nucleotide adenylyltransferase